MLGNVNLGKFYLDRSLKEILYKLKRIKVKQLVRQFVTVSVW